jgi:urease accessory protein
MRRCISVLAPGEPHKPPMDIVILPHDGRHLRRKLLHLEKGGMVMLDLKEPVTLVHGDIIELDDGDCVEVVAAQESLLEIRPRDYLHLVELAWHLGNRHLQAQIDEERILILYDHVIEDMVRGLGAQVRQVSEPFHPVRGAYHSEGQASGHRHHHQH